MKFLAWTSKSLFLMLQCVVILIVGNVDAISDKQMCGLF